MKRDQLVSTWTPFEELNSWNWQLNMQVVIDFTLDWNGNRAYSPLLRLPNREIVQLSIPDCYNKRVAFHHQTI